MFYLETQNIIKRYGEYTALSDVSIRVSKGCIYGLLGPNGAGKTSLIRIINRITAPDEGCVIINGNPSVPEDVFNIGYMPEERGLYRKMKVDEHILFLAQLRGLSKAEAKSKMEYWLNKLDIASWANKKVMELSKGMQQKIQFIATVIHDPDLYILDEPFSGLDPINAEILKDEILGLKAKGKTIILSTHNMSSVKMLCDEISLINKSKVILQGNVRDIQNKFKDHIFDVVVFGESFEIKSDSFSILSTETNSNEISVKIKKQNSDISNSSIIKEIADKYEVLSFEEKLPTMNEIFIQAVSNTANIIL